MLVCASGTAEEVYHHANFNVFKTNHSVVPLFEASLPEAQYRLPSQRLGVDLIFKTALLHSALFDSEVC